MKSHFFLVGVVLVSLFTISGFADDNEAPAREPAAEKKGDSAPREEGGFVIEKRGDTTIKYKKKTTYDFEGANIEGINNKPSGSYISNIKDVKGKSIIRIRENFDQEVMDSARLVR